MADRETELREQLAALRRRYQDEARAIVEEITKIEAAKAPSPMIYLSREIAQHLAADVDEAKMRALFPNGLSITRVGLVGESEVIDLDDFYAKPGDMTPDQVAAQEAIVSRMLDAGIDEIREQDEP